jgi:vancomycin permeability regulator SanA
VAPGVRPPGRRYPERVFTRRRLAIAAAPLAGLGALLVLPLLIVRVKTGSRLSNHPEHVGHRQVALVPGAGLTAGGRVSWFLRDRLDAAVELYQLGKVDGLLLTGDNHSTTYDEPSAMRDYAVGRGVPAAAITLDYAGFNTYDSCYRARHIFGVSEAVVVTQSYHLPRAVYLCSSVGIDAEGLGVADWGHVPTTRMVRYQARELLADAKALWDTDVIGRDPRYLGRHEKLNLQPVNG